MPRKSGEGQYPLDFNAPPKPKRPEDQVVVSPKKTKSETSPGVLFEAEMRPRATPEQTEAGQLRVFYNYIRNLNLKESDLNGLDILDVGASSGDFGDIAARFGAHVISIDEAKPKYSEDVLEGNSRKLFCLPAESMQLADRLNLSQEPKFDLVISHYSTPYVFVNVEQDRFGRWKSKKPPLEWRMEMLTRIRSSMENIFKHLKDGGKAILYPLFLHLDKEEELSVDFGNGEKRNVREFNGVMHEVLNELLSEYRGQFDATFKTIPQKDGTKYTRLIIHRQNLK